LATSDIHPSADDWTLEITPRNDLFHIPLGDIWRYRDLLWMFVKRDFVSFYKQTILGPLWFFIQPIFMTLVFTLVFGQIGQLAPPNVPQILFYLCGITFWNYFAECLNIPFRTLKQ
jgi:lipopolysaccharide transport system permease protein